MKLAIILSQTDPETCWNALRLANYSLFEGDEVGVFLAGKGVELDKIEDPDFDVKEQAEKFLADGGKIEACGACLHFRNSKGSDMCPMSTLKEMYDLIAEADKVVSF